MRYLAQGRAWYGPHLIDKLGTPSPSSSAKPGRRTRASGRAKPAEQKVYRFGQIGAMVADYKAHDVYIPRRQDAARVPRLSREVGR
jgi:hypothetical protein